jgi:A/G-specific adenine glycosylase
MQQALLDWYEVHRRNLPWRETAGPYRVWLSEIMCQQTRVDTVIPYYQRFLARWPTVQDLAAATQQDVLSQWAGLGYYSRARNLHRTAQQVAQLGAFPQDLAGLQRLPGVGRYTAGAIASIAFGQDAPVVDGNVERVLTRLSALALDPRSTQGRKTVWAHAAKLLVPGVAGTWNQAIMELGALICTPRSPSCDACPVVADCAGHASGDPERWPIKAKRKAPERIVGSCGAWTRADGSVWMARRPTSGLLGGLWELPGYFGVGAEEPQAQVKRAFWDRCNLEVSALRPVGQVVHVFTHRHLTLDVYRVEAQGVASPSWYTELGWIDRNAQQRGALSTLAKKTLALVQED